MGMGGRQPRIQMGKYYSVVTGHLMSACRYTVLWLVSHSLIAQEGERDTDKECGFSNANVNALRLQVLHANWVSLGAPPLLDLLNHGVSWCTAARAFCTASPLRNVTPM